MFRQAGGGCRGGQGPGPSIQRFPGSSQYPRGVHRRDVLLDAAGVAGGGGATGLCQAGAALRRFFACDLGFGRVRVLRVDHVSCDFGVVCVVHVYACAQFGDFHLHDFYVAEAAGSGGWGERGGVGEEIAAEGTLAAVAAERTGGAANPSARVLILTLIGIVLLNYALVNMLGLKTWRRTAEQA